MQAPTLSRVSFRSRMAVKASRAVRIDAVLGVRASEDSRRSRSTVFDNT
jgi:hypothetical protein